MQKLTNKFFCKRLIKKSKKVIRTAKNELIGVRKFVSGCDNENYKKKEAVSKGQPLLFEKTFL
jgi:hypothetical protein